MATDTDTTAATPAQPEPVEHTWIYTGQRLDSSNKLNYTWRDHEGESRWYDKLKGRAIGAAYRVYQPADKPGSVYTSGKWEPRFLSRDADDVDPADVRAWEIEDRLATTRKAALGAEKREAQVAELKQALAPIRERYRRTIGSRERAALLALAIQEITG